MSARTEQEEREEDARVIAAKGVLYPEQLSDGRFLHYIVDGDDATWLERAEERWPRAIRDRDAAEAARDAAREELTKVTADVRECHDVMLDLARRQQSAEERAARAEAALADNQLWFRNMAEEWRAMKARAEAAEARLADVQFIADDRDRTLCTYEERWAAMPTRAEIEAVIEDLCDAVAMRARCGEPYAGEEREAVDAKDALLDRIPWKETE